MHDPDASSVNPFVVVTGAGISAQSGIPTFRGHGGLWEEHRVQDLAIPKAFRRDPTLVWRFHTWRRDLVAAARPNDAHLKLDEMEGRLEDFLLITQNIDGLHQRAGSSNIIELHGSLRRMRCTPCHHRWVDARAPLLRPIPRCQKCGAAARPDVDWFGETIDPTMLEIAYHAAGRARWMLVIGRSAIVQPAAQIPLIAKSAGARLIEIYLERTPLTPLADTFLRGDAATSLTRFCEEFCP